MVERMKQLLIAFLVFAAGGCLAIPRYLALALYPPSSFVSVFPRSINNAGNVVVVAVDDAGVEKWFFWSDSSDYMPVLGSDGSAVTTLSGINDRNQVVGSAEGGGFIWTPDGGAVALPVPTGFDTVIPAAINQSGTVVGSVTSGDRSASFMWTSEAGIQLLGPKRQSAAVAVNNLGQILANTEKKFDRTVAILARDENSLTKLFPFDRGGQTIGVDLNDVGTVALNCFDSAQFPCVWTKADGVKTISVAAGFSVAIDNSEHIVGYNTVISNLSPGGFIWSPTEGAFNLDKLLVPGSPRFRNLAPTDISEDSGIVSCSAILRSENVGVILYPQPSASSHANTYVENVYAH
jgi:hypothetical protein